MRLQTLFAFTNTISWAFVAAAQSSSFPYGRCTTSPATSNYEVLPGVTNPAPYTYCFTLQLRSCSSSASSCCTSGDVARFVLHAGADCDGAEITATLQNQPLPNVAISRPPTAPSNRRVLTIPGLRLNTSNIGPDGMQLCIKLPSTGRCNTFNRLAVGDSAWSAALVSTDARCCPVSRGTPTPRPAAGTCQTCLVWDVVGPDGTAATTKYDFFSNSSCMLPETGITDINCCQWAATHMLGMFDGYRGDGVVLSGFDSIVCDRTSIRMCGTLDSAKAAANPFFQDWEEYGYVGMIQMPYDITDNMCPLALISSTIRLYAAKPGTNSLDTKCTRFNKSIEDQCGEPDREDVWWWLNQNKPGANPFPKEICDSNPGVTPFTVDPYEDLRFGDTTNLYCINIGTAAPAQPESACGKTTTIDRVSFWMMDDEERKPHTLGVYLLSLSGGEYYRRRLNATWGPDGDNTLNVRSLGLELATVEATRPKICLERGQRPYEGLGADSVDDYNVLWSALYDSSGKCCPAYYSNTY